MLKWRLMYGSIMIVAFSGLFAADWWLASRARELSLDPAAAKVLEQGLVVAVVFSILSVLATIELCRLGEAKGLVLPQGLLALCVLILVLQACFTSPCEPNAPFAVGRAAPSPVLAVLGTAAIGLLGTAVFQMCRRTTKDAAVTMAWACLAMVYLGGLGAILTMVRRDFGPAELWFVILVAKGADIGAYFTGRTCGRRKLIPWLSPGKTVEGLIGALVFAGLLAIGFAEFSYIIKVSEHVPAAVLAGRFGLGVLLAGAGHFGDLVESLIKRDCGAKDSASLVPAFGGVLDVIDSVLAVGAVYYFGAKAMESLGMGRFFAT